MSASTPAAMPEQLGPYRILDKLGQGGMGAVYLAHDTQHNRQVALKVAHLAGKDSDRVRERFLREARAAFSLNHPGLCPVFDCGESNGLSYLAMAYIEGPTLDQWQKKSRPRPPKEAAALVARLAQAMDAAHKAGVIHRDLKPSNIKLTPRGEPVILDFGLARRMDAREMRLTQTGAIMGTPYYMAPEQVLGEKQQVGPASDIYALGVILYELLTARLPFEGEEITPVLIKIAQDPPPPPSKYRADLDPRLEAICLKALAKKPEERFASVAELVQALTACARTDGTAAARTREKVRPAPAPRAPDEPVRQTFAGLDSEMRGRTPGARSSRRGRRLLAVALVGLLGVILPTVLIAVLGGGRRPVATNRDGGKQDVVHAPTKDRGAAPSAVKDTSEKPPPVPRPKEIVNSIGMSLVPIPAGRFRMGSPPREKDRRDDEIQHEVEITKSFYLGVFEVTQDEYRKVMGTNPSHFCSTAAGKDKVAGLDTRRFPVEQVSWPDAMEFCRRLSDLPEEKQAGRVYRLPTEAEWEYACRGGEAAREAAPYHFGTTLSAGQANSPDSRLGSTAAIGSYPPNGLGLYDMHGNVQEWCQDWYGPFNANPVRDPQGPLTGTNRVLRGGCWLHPVGFCRTAARGKDPPSNRKGHFGFRVVCDLASRRP